MYVTMNNKILEAATSASTKQSAISLLKIKGVSVEDTQEALEETKKLSDVLWGYLNEVKLERSPKKDEFTKLTELRPSGSAFYKSTEATDEDMVREIQSWEAREASYRLEEGTAYGNKVITNYDGKKAKVYFDDYGREVTRITNPDAKPGQRDAKDYSWAVRYPNPDFYNGLKDNEYMKYKFDGDGIPLYSIKFTRDGRILEATDLPTKYSNGKVIKFSDTTNRDNVSSYSAA